MDIKLFPRINSANKQINFQLNKKCLPKDLKDKLPNLKSIKLSPKDFEF